MPLKVDTEDASIEKFVFVNVELNVAVPLLCTVEEEKAAVEWKVALPVVVIAELVCEPSNVALALALTENCTFV